MTAGATSLTPSLHFGCFGSFSIKKTSRVSLRIARSTDGGATWSSKQVTAATPTGKNQFWNGCTLRTDSRGTVYVFFEGSVKDQRVHMMVRSFDGGVSFERARPVAPVTPVGAFDAFQDRLRFDGVRGGRTNSDPSVDISNGAPTGDGATDQIVLAWSDGRDGLNHEELLVQSSRDRGETWSTPVNLAEDGDRPNFPAVAISPDGEDLYLVYNAHLDPYRSTTVQPRRMQGVVRHAEVSVIDGQISNVTTLHRGAIGDTRGAGGNLNPFQEFLGDYNNAVATNDYGSAVWVDARNAAVCPAVNDYRELFLIGGSAITPPFLATDCPFEFGNTDIFGFTATDPTP